MTKGIITAVENRAAEYRLRLEFDTSQAQKISDRLKQQLIDLVQPILDAEVALIELQNQLNTKADQVDQAIKDAQVGGPSPPETERVSALLKELARLNADKISKEADVQRLKLQRVIAAKAKTQIDNAMDADVFDAQAFFCADYTLDLRPGAEVGVCLIPGENTGATLTIYPAYEETSSDDPARAAKWTAEKFGQLVPPYSMTPEACFYNWAILPGWQRWMPTFRHATITSIDKEKNTANVDVDTARSSVTKFVSGAGSRGLNVNETAVQPYRMENVPIKYMECDCDAFRVGDRVIVEFTDRIVRETRIFLDNNTDPPTAKTTERIDIPAWKEGNSRIIGFIENPRPCPVFVEHGWLRMDVVDTENGALLYPSPNVLSAEGDEPPYLDEEILPNSKAARDYENEMTGLSILAGEMAKVGKWKEGLRPGNCTGLLRLAVQAQYGTRFGSQSLIDYAIPESNKNSTFGIYASDTNFYMIQVSAGAVIATKLKVAPVVSELVKGKSGDELTRARCYMLASATVDGPNDIKEINEVLGTTFAYGWKFNSDGTEASIVTEESIFDESGNILQYHTGRIYKMSLSITEGTDLAGNFDFALSVSMTEQESVNYTPVNNKSLLLFPNYKEFKNEHVIWHALPQYTLIDSEAPIACFYDANDKLQILRHRLEQTTQVCTLADFNDWSASVKSCDLEQVSDTYECLVNPIKSGFFTDEIDTSGEDGGNGYYGDLTVSGEVSATNQQTLAPHLAGWSESRLCGSRHDWDSEPDQLPGRKKVTWHGGDKIVYFVRSSGGYVASDESMAIIPFWDAESFYLGSFRLRTTVGDIIDSRKNVTLRATGASGGGDTAFLTWFEDGGFGNGVSDGITVEGPDNGVLERYERDVDMHLQHRNGLEENISGVSVSTNSGDEAIELFGPWDALWNPELFVYRFFDVPIIVRQSYDGELIYTGNPVEKLASDRTEKEDFYPNDVTVETAGEHAGWV